MDVFIVRPFGQKWVKKKDQKTAKVKEEKFDFDRVQMELIIPAVQQLNASRQLELKVGTTGEIFEPGDIRQDMFSLLLLADMVIADITIHNANVFYELGIRHALRDKKTVLLKCPGYDDTPFDIMGYKYVSYKKNKPAEALDLLVNTLKETITTDRTDSPVFNMLPKLISPDTERFLAVPPDFGEEVEIARAGKQLGKLALMAAEVKGMPWQMPALRVVGEVQFKLKAFENAKTTWETIRGRYPQDVEANDRLATICQRLAEGVMGTDPVNGEEHLTQSDQAVQRLLNNRQVLNKDKLAEVYSLRARNAKARWMEAWKNVPKAQQQKKALQSPYLRDAYEDYERGYNEDLNHFYSGINALGLLTVMISLAESIPEAWELKYDSTEKAQRVLAEYETQRQKLAVVVDTSVQAKKKQLKQEEAKDPWLNMTEADLNCLTSRQPKRVESLYQEVIQQSNDLNFEAAKRQLIIYQELGVMPDNVEAALQAFKDTKEFTDEPPRHYLLFTGHMIDHPDRKEPRFPASKEVDAKQAIRKQVLEEVDQVKTILEIKAKQKITNEQAKEALIGIAGGANGGDILFHEVCQELGISTELYLALPRGQYIVESVEFAGPEWVNRFNALIINETIPKRILSSDEELPKWLRKKPNYNIWERTNLWMLYRALSGGGINMSLIALWDGKDGDGAGGTEHMVKEAQSRGTRTVVIKINKL